MQFWPRKRARRQYARVRSWPARKESLPMGFAGYKAGMAHVLYTDNRKSSKTKGQDISCPVTILECPPLKAVSVKLYKKDTYGKKTAGEIVGGSEKDLSRKIRLPKQTKEKELEKINPENYDDMTLLVCTQPRLTGIGKKKPEIFEVAVGGGIKERLEYAKSILGKEIRIGDIFKEGALVDTHAVTKGKGLQGPVKRFGIGLRPHKSEKTKRGPGSLGGWKGHAHFMYRIAHAGQTGYHQRKENNKWIMKIGIDESEIEKINPKGGFPRYGRVKNPFLLLKGSVAGPSKRMIRLTIPERQNNKIPKDAPSIQRVILG